MGDLEGKRKSDLGTSTARGRETERTSPRLGRDGECGNVRLVVGERRRKEREEERTKEERRPRDERRGIRMIRVAIFWLAYVATRLSVTYSEPCRYPISTVHDVVGIWPSGL